MAAITAISAPYNFVPLSDWVHKPTWFREVSHDLPFGDGLCGHLDLRIKAETPILVGREQQRAHARAMGVVEPYQLPNKRYALPGSALKGMIRAVLEIATFSRMQMVDERRFGVRDLGNSVPQYKRAMTTMAGRNIYKPLTNAGWLEFDRARATWTIRPCDYARVQLSELRRYHGTSWFDATTRPPPPAEFKYEEWEKLRPLDVSFTLGPGPIRISDDNDGKPRFIACQEATNLGTGTSTGTLVFTGQPNPGKHLEFVFFNPGLAPLSVPDAVFSAFLDIHDQKMPGGGETAWDFWQRKPRVPVFYLTDSSSGEVTSFGLALMYKLAYRYSVHEAIRNTSAVHLDGGGDDFTSLLFGRVGDAPADCLKGRVRFMHARCDQDAPQPESHGPTILNGPKASYYPNYVQQPAAKGGGRLPADGLYTTYMDDACKIRGWKRYPARPYAAVQPLTPAQSENEAVQVRLHPLPAGSTFTSRVRVHNLKPEEIGALCWALTWGGSEKLRHSLGMGKSFGFGQVSIEIGDTRLRPNRPGTNPPSWQECRDTFIKHMDKAYRNKHGRGPTWRSSKQVLALLGMADPELRPVSGELRHMRLTTEDDNEFKNAKGALLVLADYPSGTHPPLWSDAEKEKREAEETAANAIKEIEEAERIRRMSEEERAVHFLDATFKEYEAKPDTEQRASRAEFLGKLNGFAEAATGWASPEDRGSAANLLKEIFESIGWADPGRNRQQRTRQEARRRTMVERVRTGHSSGNDT